MTVYGGGGYGGGTPAPRPAPPPPPPQPPPSNTDAGMGYTPQQAALNTQAAINQAPQGAPPSHTDVSGGGYGGQNVDAFKASPGYQEAIAQVFSMQAPHQQAAILQGLAHGGDPWTIKAVRTAVATLPFDQLGALHDALPHSSGGGGGVLGIASTLGSKLLSGIGFAGEDPGKLASAATTVVGNAAKDAYNLPASTVEGLYGLGSQLAQGNVGNAFHMVVDPYVQLFEHPGQMLTQHPLNSLLMLAGPKAVIGRGAGFAARSGALGDAAQAAAATARSDVSLGTFAGAPAPIFESRTWSPDLINKIFQGSRESVLRARKRNPDVASVAPRGVPTVIRSAFNLGQDAKLNRIADELAAVRQMHGTGERGVMLTQLKRAAPPQVAQNVVSHILQGVIRKPATAVEDATKEINRLKAAQTGSRLRGEFQNRAQVRDLSRALATPGALDQAFKAAAKLRPVLHHQDAQLVDKALLDPHQALRSRLIPYAMAHMGVKYDPKGLPPQFAGDAGIVPQFRHADNRPLRTQEILDHLKANGVPDPAYVGHFPAKGSPMRFFRAYRMARGTMGHKRTGTAFEKGAYDHTYAGLAGQMASRAQYIATASLHDHLINRAGIGMPKEMQQPLLDRLNARRRAGSIAPEAARTEEAAIRAGMMTPDEARGLAQSALVDDHGNPIPNAIETTPITATPKGTMAAVLDRGLQHSHDPGDLHGAELNQVLRSVDDAASRHDQTRNVLLVPRAMHQQLAEHYARTDSMLRQVGRVTQQFRRTVLPYSTHWMLQIGSEAALRALVRGALDPRYLADGRRLEALLEHTPEGRAANAEMVNSAFGSMSAPTGGGVRGALRDLVRGNDTRGQLDIHSKASPLTAAAKAFPPSRLLIAAHNRYANLIGQAMYGLEHQFRLMGLGKLAHEDVHRFGFSWSNAVRLQGQAMAQLASRLEVDPALVARFGRSIDETFGKYNKFSPKVRSATQSFAPFLPWYLNAAKFVLWHLPAHHPVASALMASLRQTISQDIKDGKTLPLNSYAMQELGRISPFGIFTPPDQKPTVGGALVGQHYTGAFLPQVESLLYNLAGRDSFGSGPLKEPSPSGKGKDVKALSGPSAAAAGESFLEAFMPLARYWREGREGGKPSFGTSTVLDPQPKPGSGPVSAASIANRIFNPFYSFERSQAAKNAPDYGKGKQSSSSSGGGRPSLSRSLGGGQSSSGDLSRSLGGGSSSSGSLSRSLGG